MKHDASCNVPNGFTLLELLVAAALIAVAATVIAGAFAAGFRVWQRASATGDGDAAVSLEWMQKDLCNTVPCRLVSFQGSENRMEIPSLVTVGDQVQPGAVRYELNDAAHTLDRITRSYPLPGADIEKRETLMESVDDVRFSYGEWVAGNMGAGVWGSVWSGRTNTPGAVKISLKFKQGEERIERERTIILPCR